MKLCVLKNRLDSAPVHEYEFVSIYLLPIDDYRKEILKGNVSMDVYDCAWACYDYAFYNNESRFEIGEEFISKDSYCSLLYALDILKGRFKLGEDAISKDQSYSYWYARDILKGRFLLGEQAISMDAWYSKLYKEFLKDLDNNRQK